VFGRYFFRQKCSLSYGQILIYAELKRNTITYIFGEIHSLDEYNTILTLFNRRPGMSNDKKTTIEELLAKATKPAADAMKLHPFYRGKVETALKCTVHDFNDFAIWYTPGVAAV
jgi:hypothetical protein